MRSDVGRRAVEAGLRHVVAVAGEVPAAETIANRMVRYGVPGMSIAVVEDGSISWAAGYGQLAAGGAAVTPDTLFQAASISKLVNALVVLALASDGRIGLDVPVNAQLQTWQLQGPHADEVTVRQLLGHAAGTGVSGFPGYAPDDALPSVLEVLAGRPPANSPAVVVESADGPRSQYSGGGVMVLHLLVEEATGRSYGDVAGDLVFEPLGMRRSHFRQPPRPGRAADVAVGHDEAGVELVGGMRVYPELAAAGLWSSADDLARLIIGLQAAAHGEPGALIDQELARAMTSTVETGHFGLGVQLAGRAPHRRAFHNGTNLGYCCQVEVFLQHRRGVAILTNGDGGNMLIVETLAAIGDAYRWPGYERRIVEPQSLPLDLLERLAGDYVSAFGRRFEIRHDGRELFSTAIVGRRRLLPIDGGVYVDEQTGAELTFDLPAGGGPARGATIRHEGVVIFTVAADR